VLRRGKGKRGKRRWRGLTAYIFGGQWDQDRSELEVMRDLIIELGGKRVFIDSLDSEYEAFVNDSIIEVREFLTTALKTMPEGSHSYASVSAMRGACNEYLDAAPDPIRASFTHLRPHFRLALQRWRDTVQLELQSIGHALDLDEARTLARRIPHETVAFPQHPPGEEREIYIPPPDDLPFREG
jgi:hypothetical protein